MRALVTGGGGFLGRAIVRQLLARGDSVRLLARGDYPALAALGVDCRRGDLRRAADVRAACDGCDTVFHTAALADYWGPRAEFEAVNVQGTEHVLAGCRAAGVGRLVYTSTPSVVFAMGDLEGVDESQPYPARFRALYAETKARAEQAVLAANGRDGLATCALRPHLIYGPDDPHIVAMLIQRARAGSLVRIGPGTNRVDLTYVDNAAHGHLLAAAALRADAPPGGRAYFLSDGAPVAMWPWIDELLAALDLPPVRRHLPLALALALAAIGETAYTWLPLRGRPRLTRFLAANFATSHWFAIDAARRDFGYAPLVPPDEALRRTVAWFREHPPAAH